MDDIGAKLHRKLNVCISHSLDAIVFHAMSCLTSKISSVSCRISKHCD